MKMMEKGIFRKAKWYDVVQKYPPLAPPGNRRKPPRIVLEEDSLYEELYENIPQLQYTPLNIGQSLYGDRFVVFQLMNRNSSTPLGTYVISLFIFKNCIWIARV